MPEDNKVRVSSVPLSEVFGDPRYQEATLPQRESINNKWFDDYSSSLEADEDRALAERKRIAVNEESKYKYLIDHGSPSIQREAKEGLNSFNRMLDEFREARDKGGTEEEFSAISHAFAQSITKSQNNLKKERQDHEAKVDLMVEYGQRLETLEGKLGVKGMAKEVFGAIMNPIGGMIKDFSGDGPQSDKKINESIEELNEEFKAKGLTPDLFPSLQKDAKIRGQAFEEPATVNSRGEVALNYKTLMESPQKVIGFIDGLDAPRAEKEQAKDLAFGKRQGLGEHFAREFNKSTLMKNKIGGKEYDADSALAAIIDANYRAKGGRGTRDNVLAVLTMGVSELVRDPLAQTKLLEGAAAVLETGSNIGKFIAGEEGYKGNAFLSVATLGMDNLIKEIPGLADEKEGIEALGEATRINDGIVRQIGGEIYRTIPQLAPTMLAGSFGRVFGTTQKAQRGREALAVGAGATMAGSQALSESIDLREGINQARVAALIQFGTTALAAGGFSAAGLGGVESIAAGKSIEVAKKGLMAKLKAIGGGVLKEGAEEGIDEFFANLGIAKANDRYISDSDAIKQAFIASLIGGVMGGGSTAAAVTVEGVQMTQAAKDAEAAGMVQVAEALKGNIERLKSIADEVDGGGLTGDSDVPSEIVQPDQEVLKTVSSLDEAEEFLNAEGLSKGGVELVPTDEGFDVVAVPQKVDETATEDQPTETPTEAPDAPVETPESTEGVTTPETTQDASGTPTEAPDAPAETPEEETPMDYTLGGRITEEEGRLIQSSDLPATSDLDSPDYLPTTEVIRIAKKLVGVEALRDKADEMGLGRADADLETAAREILDLESAKLPYTPKRTKLPGLPKSETSQPPGADPVELRELMDEWDNEEGRFEDPDDIQVSTLIDEIESLEDIPPEAQKAIDDYRKEQDDDIEFGKRGDMDAAEDALLSSLANVVSPPPQVTPEPTPKEEPQEVESKQEQGPIADQVPEEGLSEPVALPEDTVSEDSPAIEEGDSQEQSEETRGEPTRGEATLEEDKKSLDKAISELPEESRNVFDNMFNGTKTAKELAKELGKTEMEVNEEFNDTLNELSDKLSTKLKASRSKRGSTGSKNAITDRERAEEGRKAIIKEASVSNEETLANAEERMKNSPEDARQLVEDINSGTKQSITEEDRMLILLEKQRLRVERGKQADIASSKESTNEEAYKAQDRWLELEEKISDIDFAFKRMSSAWGRLGQIMQRTISEDFSLDRMEQRARVAMRRDLSAEEQAAIKKESEEIGKLSEEEAAEQTKSDEANRKKAMADEVAKLRKQVATLKRGTPPLVKWLLKRKEANEKRKAAARKRIRERMGFTAANPLYLSVVKDVAVFAYDYMLSGAISSTEITTKFVGEFGEGVKKFTKDAINLAKKRLGKEFSEAPQKKGKSLNETLKDISVEEATKIIQKEIAENAQEGDPLQEARPLVLKYLEALIRSGVVDEDPLVQAAMDLLKPSFKDITKAQTEDLISGYGIHSEPSTDEAKVRLGQLKGEILQLSKIRDLEAGNPPKKTGPSRRPLSDVARTRTKMVNDLKRKMDIDLTDPEAQLQSARDAIKRRLRNEIRDISKAIIDLTPIFRGENTTQIDDEIKFLRERKKIKREEYNDIFNTGKSDAQILNEINQSLDRRIAEMESDIKEGRLYPSPKPIKPTNAQIEAKKERLEALKEERKLLIKMDALRVEAKKEAKLIKQIEDTLLPPKDAKPDEHIAETKAVTELRQILAEAKAARRSRPDIVDKKLAELEAAAEARVKELEEKIKTEDVAVKPKEPGITSEKLDSLRSQIKGLNKIVGKIRQRVSPRKLSEEARELAWEVRTKNSIARMKERMASGDFTTKKRKEFVPSAKMKKLQLELFEVKEEYFKRLHHEALKARTFWQKAGGKFADVSNTSRAIMTSFDLSAVGRQGALLGFSHPKLALKALVPMLKSINKSNYLSIWNDIQNDPEYNDAKDSGKLFLTDPARLDMSQVEENFASRYADKIPGVAQSARAYITYLNVLRFTAYKAMTNHLKTNKHILSDADKRVIAAYINIATGRGSLGQKSTKIASAMSSLLFSPRLLASRFQYLIGLPLFMEAGTGEVSGKVRWMIAKEYVRTARVIILIMSLAAAAAAAGIEGFEDMEIGTDWTSSEFMKMKFGNTRVDLWGGLQQATVFAGRMTDSVLVSNNLKEPGPNARFRKGAFKTTADFFRSKANPIVGSFFNAAERKNVIGEEMPLVDNPFTDRSVLRDFVVPMIYGDVIETAKEDGLTPAFMVWALNTIGVGVSNYEKKQSNKTQSLGGLGSLGGL